MTAFIERDENELVLFLILTFGGSTIQNSLARLLAATTQTNRELIQFKSSCLQNNERIAGNRNLG